MVLWARLGPRWRSPIPGCNGTYYYYRRDNRVKANIESKYCTYSETLQLPTGESEKNWLLFDIYELSE